MSTAANRRERLRLLIDDRYEGDRKRFASVAGMSESRVGQLLSPNYRNGTSFGEKAARAIETKLRLPENYFDQPMQPIESQRSEVDDLRLEADGYSLVLGLFNAIEMPRHVADAFFGPFLKTSQLRFGYAPDDTMKPTIEAGDLVFSQHYSALSFDAITEDGVFVFLYESRYYIRRLQRVGERLAVKCDNHLYETWYVEPSEIGKKFVIFGKVFKRLPMKFDNIG